MWVAAGALEQAIEASGVIARAAVFAPIASHDEPKKDAKEGRAAEGSFGDRGDSATAEDRRGTLPSSQHERRTPRGSLPTTQPAAQPATQPVELTIVAWPFDANESLGVDELRVAVEAAMERSGALAVVADRAANAVSHGAHAAPRLIPRVGTFIRAHEPWEYRPRAKLQGWLRRYFVDPNAAGGRWSGRRSGAQGEDRRIAPGGDTDPMDIQRTSARAVAAEVAPSLNLLTSRMSWVLSVGGVRDKGTVAFVTDALLACVPSDAQERYAPYITSDSFGSVMSRSATQQPFVPPIRGSCLLRDTDGALREPNRRLLPYEPQAALGSRLSRFDSEPWHIWDLRELCEARRWGEGRRNVGDGEREPQRVASSHHHLLHDPVPPYPTYCAPEQAPSAAALAAAFDLLDAKRQELIDILPAVWPSLGLLFPLDARFRMRLECAAAIGRESPALLEAGKRAADVHLSVLRTCRPEWFSTGPAQP